ncbi:MAG: hypothetical protein OIF48_06735 [Silicimonas sp.]|nr:hypothetical protein [Silicimonas sp.]
MTRDKAPRTVSPKAAAAAAGIWALATLALNTGALPDWARSIHLPDGLQWQVIQIADGIDETARDLGLDQVKARLGALTEALGAGDDGFDTF